MERRSQKDRSEQARGRLLRAAIQLLAERGYAGTTLGAIGREAGLSRGLVTHHFGSKDACISEAVEQIRLGAARNLIDSQPCHGLSAIDSFLTSYMNSLRRNDVFVRAVYVAMTESISSAPGLREVVAHLNEAVRSRIRNWLNEAVEGGEIPGGTDLNAYAVVIEGMMRGVCLQYLADRERVDLDASIRAVLHAVHAALREPLAPVPARAPAHDAQVAAAREAAGRRGDGRPGAAAPGSGPSGSRPRQAAEGDNGKVTAGAVGPLGNG